MQNEDQEFEAELKRLRPRAPGPGLLARLDRELGPASSRTPRFAYRAATHWSSWKWSRWTATAMAVVAIGLVIGRNRAFTPAAAKSAPIEDGAAKISNDVPADIYKPVRADNVLYSTEEEGRLTLADGTPARRVRAEYVDTITWKNPRTHASVSWSVPREEVRIVPVSFQ